MSNQLPTGTEPLLEAAVQRFLDERKRKGATREAIEAAVGPGDGTDAIEQALRRLAQSGDVVDWKGRWFAIRYIDLEVGMVSTLDRGDALIRTGSRGEPGLFVRRRHLKGASEGDLVLLKRLQPRKGRRARASGQRLPEATVQRIVRRRYPRIVGSLETREGSRWLVPFDSRVKRQIRVEGAERVDDGVYVAVDLPVAAHHARGPIRGTISEVLGDPETPGVDVRVVLRHFDIPEVFPPEVLDRAAELPPDPAPDTLGRREDLRQRVVLTIDGETARDFDDAISIETLPGGGFELGVHIADVAAYVSEGSELDREAYRRGTSVYYPDRAIPMLPESLSSGLCSLRPDRPRLTLSAFLTFDRAGNVRRRRFAETVIQSRRRMTYDEVATILESPQASATADGPAAGELPAEILELLRHAQSLMKQLWRRRLDRGSIDFDLPEGDVILDSEGCTVGVRPEQRTVAHRIIEEFMIAANEAVATELEGHESPALYRVHPPPDPQDLEELRWILRELGIELGGDLEALHPRVLQGLLQQVEGRSEESFVASLVLRSMQRAVYHAESRGHYALSSNHYLHFTSPIRRYPDLLVHRQLKALLSDAPAPEPATEELRRRALPRIAEHCSTTERRAEQSERTLLQWKLVRFLAGRVGDTFSGRITGVHPFGLFVQLLDYFVDGLVPIRALADDYYQFEPDNHRLVGRSNGRTFQLADEVEVVLDGVDLARRGLELRIEGLE